MSTEGTTTYWTVTLRVTGIEGESHEAAEALRDALNDLFMSLPESEDLGATSRYQPAGHDKPGWVASISAFAFGTEGEAEAYSKVFFAAFEAMPEAKGLTGSLEILSETCE